jgi:hypothetical protein
VIYKTLSVCQPWAFLLVNGIKDVENRVWSTKHRGPLLIHAGVCKSASWKKNQFSTDAALEATYDRLRKLRLPVPKIPKHLESGGIVGRVTLIECVRRPDSESLSYAENPALNSPWFVGPVGWLVSDAEPLPFTPAKGKLYLFDFDL